MEYEIKEANGKDYPLGVKPKRMLTWDNDRQHKVERDVLGYYNGLWLAKDFDGCGVCNWEHAAEIPERETLEHRVHDLHLRTGYFPYVVHPDGVDLGRDVLCHCISVPESEVLINANAIADKTFTFVVMAGCSDTTKAMFKMLEGYHSRNGELVAVQFFD